MKKLELVLCVWMFPEKWGKPILIQTEWCIEEQEKYKGHCA